MLLKKGSKGPKVVELQNMLNAAGSQPRLVADGDFGNNTLKSVKYFQARHKDQNGSPLTVDGEVGDRTWGALVKANGGTPPPPPKPEQGGSVGQRICRIALGEASKGVVEVGGDNRGKDVYKYQSSTGLGGTGWPWCAAFVTWCYEQAGLVLNTSAGFASVYLMEQWARKTGRWKPRVSGYVAPAGSILIFTFSHTGIVISGGKSSDATCEGNTSSGNAGSQRNGGGVYRRTRSHSIIKGYVVMKEILKK
jgi:peptidoglycan hydrolase-like protein with peptidoglycan-binding domain